MSLFRTSRLLTTARLPISCAAGAPAAIRHKTTNAASTSVAARRQTAAAASAHETESDPPIDGSISAYSPVASFPATRAANVLSGAPIELQARTVRIYKPAKNATQSGNWNTSQWKMDWDVLPRGHRWENPLMGWQSSGDPMQGTHLFFKTKEDAVNFAEKQGYDWYVQEPNTREFRPKSYAANFLHSPKELKIIRTK